MGVRVLSQVYFYRENGMSLAPIGSLGCVADTELVPVDDYRFMSLARPPGFTGSDHASRSILGALDSSDDCLDHTVRFEDGPFEPSDVQWVRAIPASEWLEHMHCRADGPSDLVLRWRDEFG